MPVKKIDPTDLFRRADFPLRGYEVHYGGKCQVQTPIHEKSKFYATF